MTENTTVIVIGGGYAGTLAANQLLANKNLTVTLVNPRPHFVERIRLHQLVAGNATATAGYDKLLNPAVSLVVDKVTYIDAGAQKLELASGAVLPYDYLVYAVGSTTSTPDVPGWPNTPCPSTSSSMPNRCVRDTKGWRRTRPSWWSARA